MSERNDVLPEGMTGEKLRKIADWLDTYDRMAEIIAESMLHNNVQGPTATDAALRTLAAQEVVRSTEVQDDLRRWAAQIEGSDD